MNIFSDIERDFLTSSPFLDALFSLRRKLATKLMSWDVTIIAASEADDLSPAEENGANNVFSIFSLFSPYFGPFLLD